MLRTDVLLVMACIATLLPTASGQEVGRRTTARPTSPGAPPALVQKAYLKASNPDAMDQFGTSLAVSGDTVVVGVPLEDSSATGVNGDQDDDSLTDAGAVYVFTRTPAGWEQQAYLKASNSGEFDSFGEGIAISGDTLVVGAPFEDSDATGVNGDEGNDDAFNSGAVYVFVRNGTSWSQEAYLKASNSGSGDLFGMSVALLGDTLIVGASREDSSSTGIDGDQSNDASEDAGAAYAFARAGSSWTQQAYLKASNTDAYDLFGTSVSASEDFVVVGAFGEDSNATGVNGNQSNNSASSSGAAYVFVRDGTTWSHEAYVKASNTGASDFFGYPVVASSNTLVVGAHQEDSNATGVNGDGSNNTAPTSGAAYVFTRQGTTWSQEAYLKASNSSAGDFFGYSVAASMDLVLVGAFGEDSNATGVNGDQTNNAAPNAGAGYLFQRSGSRWSQAAYLKASNTAAGDFFGESVSLSGGILVLAATLEDSAATGVNGDSGDNGASAAGAGYVFELCSQATVLFRNGGSNPASYTASPIVIGTTFTATVDNNLASQSTSILIAFDTSFLFTLGGGQTLLCLDLGGSGEAFTGAGLFPSSSAGGVDSFSLPFANDPSTCGVVFYSQAIQFGNPPFVLSNAQDLTIGSF